MRCTYGEPTHSRPVGLSAATELSSRMAMLGIGIMSAWIAVELLIGNTRDLAIEIAVTLALIAFPVLERLGHGLASRVGLVLAANFVVGAGAVLYEPNNLGLLPFVPMVGLPLMIFDAHEVTWRRAGALLPIVLALVIDAHGPGPVLGIARAAAPTWHRTANLVAAMALTAGQVAWWIRPSAHAAAPTERDVSAVLVSHELRTPATALRLQVTLLRRFLAARTDLDARATALLRACESTSGQLTALVDNLYDLAGLRSGRIALVRVETDLAAVAQRVVDMLDVARFTGVGRVRLHGPGPVVGHWDATRLEQALCNLVANALKYGGDGPVDLVVTRDADGRWARIEVHDQGIGIPPELQERVFRAWERGDADAQIEGFGLGLYLVREIAAAHGGHVRLTSTVGEGSCFALELPLAATPQISVRG